MNIEKHIIRIAFWTSALAVMFIVFAVAAFAQDAVLQDHAVQVQMVCLYKTMLFDKYEHAFSIKGDWTPTAISSSAASRSVHVNVRTDDLAFIHTHPPGTDQHPSQQDIAIAQRMGFPNYELSVFALWVAMPDGTSHKVGDVNFKHGELEIK